MSQQPRAPAWARFMARATINPPPPPPVAQPTTTTPAPPPTQPLQPRAPFPQPVRAPVMPSQFSQPRQPTPPPPPAAAPAPPPSQPSAAAPPAPAKSPPRSPVAPPVPAPSTPRRSPISAPPTTAPSPKSSAPPPPPETTTSASKSPIIKTLPNSPVPKAPLTTSTNVQVQSSPNPESPKTKTQAPSSSLPASPVPKPVATGAPKSTPKTVKPLEKTPVQSPKPKTVAPPPSPLTLPPSQIKADSDRESKTPTKFEQKDVLLVQETIEKLPKLMPTNTQNSSTASNGRQEFTKEKVPNKKISDSEKLGMSVITLAGENKGAVMELSPHKKNHSTTNPHSLHKNTHYTKLWNEGEKSSSDEEGRSNKEKNNKAMAMQSPPMTAYVNSNVQGVNNSIFFNGSSTHQNPGVHLTISRKSNGGHGIHHKDHHA